MGRLLLRVGPTTPDGKRASVPTRGCPGQSSAIATEAAKMTIETLHQCLTIGKILALNYLQFGGIASMVAIPFVIWLNERDEAEGKEN